MFGPELCGFSLWWIFPIVMIVFCFFMMRRRVGSMMCGNGSRSIDDHKIADSDSSAVILDKRYALEAVRRTLTSTGRAMFFTTVILSTGFFILLFAELKSTINFGIITGFTICTALLADFLLAPAMMVLLSRKKERDHNVPG